MDEQNSQVPAPQITPTQKHYPAKKVWTIAGIVAAVVLIGGVLGYLEIRNKYLILPVPPLPGVNGNPQDPVSSGSYPPDYSQNPPPQTDYKFVNSFESQTCKNTLPTLTSRSGNYEWVVPKKIENLKIYEATSQDTDFLGDDSYLVGYVKKGKYQGGDIILSIVSFMGMGTTEDYDHFIRLNNKFTYLGRYSSNPEKIGRSLKPLVDLSIDPDYVLEDLDFPEKLRSKNSAADFSIVNQFGFYRGSLMPFCADGLVKAFTDPNIGDVYQDADSEFTDQNGNIVISKNGFYVKAPDGTTRSYKLEIGFVGADNVPAVIWNNGSKNSSEYSFQAIGGCGSTRFRDIAEVNEADLIKIGTVPFNGDAVYGYKNSQNTELTEMYSSIYMPEGQEKPSYTAFIASRPIFFWKDQFGKFIRFKIMKYQPMAECGKPVIYLYPETTQKVSVKVSPVGGFTFTEPAYNQGWNVISDPLSNITNLADGKVYPYLFWEGRGGMYQTPDRGFVVKQVDVHNFLLEKLAKLGLNTKESADFMEYWEPKMQGSRYYFVTFMGNSTMDALAPLEVSPKPDTVIRILMDFVPLEKPIAVQDFNIRTPERKGFTVVEWGGVRRK